MVTNLIYFFSLKKTEKQISSTKKWKKHINIDIMLTIQDGSFLWLTLQKLSEERSSKLKVFQVSTEKGSTDNDKGRTSDRVRKKTKV